MKKSHRCSGWVPSGVSHHKQCKFSKPVTGSFLLSFSSEFFLQYFFFFFLRQPKSLIHWTSTREYPVPAGPRMQYCSGETPVVGCDISVMYLSHSLYKYTLVLYLLYCTILQEHVLCALLV